MGPIEQPKTTVQGNIAPPRPVPSFVFIDLRENPESWAEIENELLDNTSFPVY